MPPRNNDTKASRPATDPRRAVDGVARAAGDLWQVTSVVLVVNAAGWVSMRFLLLHQS